MDLEAPRWIDQRLPRINIEGEVLVVDPGSDGAAGGPSDGDRRSGEEPVESSVS